MYCTFDHVWTFPRLSQVFSPCITSCNTYICFPSFAVPSVCSIVLLQCLILLNAVCVCHIWKDKSQDVCEQKYQ